MSVSRMTPRLRVALVGYGYAGMTFHAPLIRATPGLELAAVVTRNAERVRKDLPESQPLASAAEALSDPHITVIVIATPNDTHAPLAAAALRAGKHVVVDKPFTLSLAQARRLGRLAEERALTLSVFQNRRWDSDFLALESILAHGDLGRLTHLESRFDRFRPKVRDRWRETASSGGGVWFDLGPHLVDQALTLFGLPQRVGGTIVRQRAGAKADDWCQIQLDYGRLQVTLSASLLVGGGIPRFAAHGTLGSWIKHGLDVQEDQLRAGMRPGEPGWGDDPQQATLYTEGAHATEMSVPAGAYQRYYAEFRDAVLGRGANPVTPAQAVATMSVLETAVEAVNAECWLTLPLTDSECIELGKARFDLAA